MTEFSKSVASCISDWGKRAAARNASNALGKVSLEDKENRQLCAKFQKELDEIMARYF